MQRQTSGAADPYERDQEMVAFLQSAGSPGFAIVNDAPELNVGQQKPAMVFLVRDGRITDAPTDFAEYVGATLDGFSYELRAAAAGAGPDFSGRWKFSMEPDFRGKATTVTGEIDQRGIDLVVRCRDEETAVMRGVLNARTAWKRPAQVKRRT